MNTHKAHFQPLPVPPAAARPQRELLRDRKGGRGDPAPPRPAASGAGATRAVSRQAGARLPRGFRGQRPGGRVLQSAALGTAAGALSRVPPICCSFWGLLPMCRWGEPASATHPNLSLQFRRGVNSTILKTTHWSREGRAEAGA